MKKKQTFFAKRLKELLVKKGFTQQVLADRLGIEQAMISQWLIGFRNPSIASLKKIAAALDVPFNYFIEDNEDFGNDIENIKTRMKLMEEKIKSLEKENLILKDRIKTVEEKIS